MDREKHCPYNQRIKARVCEHCEKTPASSAVKDNPLGGSHGVRHGSDRGHGDHCGRERIHAPRRCSRRPHEAELKRISSAIAPNTDCRPTCPGLWASARPSEHALAPRSAQAACVQRAGAGVCRIADGRHDDRRIRSTGQRRRGRSGPVYVQRPDRTRRPASGSPRHSRGRSRSLSLDAEPRPGEPRGLARYTPRSDQSQFQLSSQARFRFCDIRCELPLEFRPPRRVAAG